MFAGGQIGSRISVGLDKKKLKKGLGWFLLVIAATMLVRLRDSVFNYLDLRQFRNAPNMPEPFRVRMVPCRLRSHRCTHQRVRASGTQDALNWYLDEPWR